MKKLSNLACLVLGVSTLMACSTITTGTHQPVRIATAKVEGAQCDLTDNKDRRWHVYSTPETVEVRKGEGPLIVTCRKVGYKTAQISVDETFSGATLGNVILGGGIGIIVDAASGAAQRFPDDIMVWMEPESFPSAAAKQQWMAEKAAYDAAQEAKKKERYERDAGDNDNYN